MVPEAASSPHDPAGVTWCSPPPPAPTWMPPGSHTRIRHGMPADSQRLYQSRLTLQKRESEKPVGSPEKPSLPPPGLRLISQIHGSSALKKGKVLWAGWRRRSRVAVLLLAGLRCRSAGWLQASPFLSPSKPRPRSLPFCNKGASTGVLQGSCGSV